MPFVFYEQLKKSENLLNGRFGGIPSSDRASKHFF